MLLFHDSLQIDYPIIDRQQHVNTHPLAYMRAFLLLPPPPRTNSPLLRSATGLRKKTAAANAALHTEVRELSERVEMLAASSKRREKAQSLREKATALARSMEIKRIQV